MKRCPCFGSLALTLVSLVVVTTLGCHSTGHAGLPEWVLYNTNNSQLPHGDGFIITFDAQGNAWRGTEGGGAARTDGMGDWLFYNTSNSGLPCNDVICVAFDRHGSAWIATWGGGVARFDGAEEWTVYDTSNSGLPDDYVAALAIDDRGNIWMGTRSSGLARFDGTENWTVYDTSNSGLPGNAISALAMGSRWNLWISTRSGGLAKFGNEGDWSVFDISNSVRTFPTIAYFALDFDREGNLWIGTESDGAVKFDGEDGWTAYNTSNSGLPDDFVNDFAFDDEGNVWMATQGGGVARFDGRKAWEVYNKSNSRLPHDYVMGVSFDSHGNLWIGTGRAHDSGASRGGVAVYRQGGVIPHGLGLEFAQLTSATTTLAVTQVNQATPIEISVAFDAPLEGGKTLWLDLSPLGPDLMLEHAGEGRYTGRTTVTPVRNAHYNLPVIVQTAEGVRYRFFLATLEAYPASDLVVYDDIPREGWTVEAIGESNLASTTLVHTGYCSHAFGPGRVHVDYLYDDSEGIDLFGYSHLEFFVKGGKGLEQNLTVWHTSLKALGVVPEVDNWTRVTIPVSDLPSPLRAIRLGASMEESLYIDDMRLLAGKLKNKR